MNRIDCKLLTILLTVLGTVTPLWAQPDPLGADPFGPGRPPAEGAQPAPAAPLPLPRDNPAVAALLESNPQTPTELLNAARLFLDLGYPDLARGMVVRVRQANLDPVALVKVHDNLGSALFIRLIHEERLHPEGLEIARVVLEAAESAARDPQRLEALVRQLSDPNPFQRQIAVNDLRAAGQDSIGPILAALGDSARRSEVPFLRNALELLADVSREPLLGALGTPSPVQRVEVIGALGDLFESRAVPLLVAEYFAPGTSQAERVAAGQALQKIVGHIPNRADARRYLIREVKDYLAGRYPAAPDSEGLAVIWVWDTESSRSRPLRLPVTEAALLAASRITDRLRELEPSDPLVVRLHLLSRFASLKLMHGLDRPLPIGPGSPREQFRRETPAAVEDALAYALEHGPTSAAIAAAEILGDIGSPELLLAPDGRARPLARAMEHRDRRVRFAAVDAVMRIDPPTSYVGASRLPEAIGYFIGTEAAPRVLVGHPRRDGAQVIAGFLMEAGFDAETAVTGRELFRRAVASPDFEAIFISDALDFPEARELVQWLRRDPRTATLPIGLQARESRFDEMRLVADSDRLVEAFPRAHDIETLGFQLQRLRLLVGSRAVGAEERLFQARTALAWLRKLSEHPKRYSFYDLRRLEESLIFTLGNPLLTQEAAPVAGALGTPPLQRALVSLVSQHSRTIGDRRALAEAFAAAVRRRGLRLNRDEIVLQYERYNQTRVLDADTQELLGSVLDVIEEPRNQWDSPPAAEVQARFTES